MSTSSIRLVALLVWMAPAALTAQVVPLSDKDLEAQRAAEKARGAKTLVEGNAFKKLQGPPAAFVACSYDGRHFSVSDDGEAWRDNISFTEGKTVHDWNSVRGGYFANGVFVIHGGAGGVGLPTKSYVTSTTDGKTWSQQVLPGYFCGGTWDGKQHLLCNSKSLYNSLDGTRWEFGKKIEKGNYYLRHGGGIYLTHGRSLGDDGPMTVNFASALNGEWKSVELPSKVARTFGDSKYMMIVCANGSLATYDGKAWNIQKPLGPKDQFTFLGGGFHWTGKQYVAIGAKVVYRSSDGIKWQRFDSPGAGPATGCTKGRFATVSAYSDDAIQWTPAKVRPKVQVKFVVGRDD